MIESRIEERKCKRAVGEKGGEILGIWGFSVGEERLRERVDLRREKFGDAGKFGRIAGPGARGCFLFQVVKWLKCYG